jgi:hypothetical protein
VGLNAEMSRGKERANSFQKTSSIEHNSKKLIDFLDQIMRKNKNDWGHKDRAERHHSEAAELCSVTFKTIAAI